MKLLVTLLAFALTGIAGAEPNDKLPDFGTPADMALSKSREAQLGRGVMLQLRNAGAVVDDPQLTEYIGSLGGQIASHANNGDFKFHFFFAFFNIFPKCKTPPFRTSIFRTGNLGSGSLILKSATIS